MEHYKMEHYKIVEVVTHTCHRDTGRFTRYEVFRMQGPLRHIATSEGLYPTREAAQAYIRRQNGQLDD